MSDFSRGKRVALVTDWMTAPGGADRFLLSIISLFPEADIFTALYFKENYIGRYVISNNVYSSFMQKFPFRKKLSRHYNMFSPMAFESFDLSSYDLVISLSAGASKGVITSTETPHVGIILTPPRSLWDGESNTRGTRLRKLYGLFTPFISSYLRIWDQTAIKRVDHLISISDFIKRKVHHTYKRDSKVIYPGLDKFWYEETKDIQMEETVPENYFLVVSRLYDYKRVDWAIKAAREAGKKLVVVGEGPDKKYLQKLAGDETLFLGWVTDPMLKALYANTEALLFCGIEDYGYVPVEAMASGTPVLAYNGGGVTETVKEGTTGNFFDSIKGLTDLLINFERSKWDNDMIRKESKYFSVERFQKEFIHFLEEINAI